MLLSPLRPSARALVMQGGVRTAEVFQGMLHFNNNHAQPDAPVTELELIQIHSLISNTENMNVAHGLERRTIRCVAH